MHGWLSVQDADKQMSGKEALSRSAASSRCGPSRRASEARASADPTLAKGSRYNALATDRLQGDVCLKVKGVPRRPERAVSPFDIYGEPAKKQTAEPKASREVSDAGRIGDVTQVLTL